MKKNSSPKSRLPTYHCHVVETGNERCTTLSRSGSDLDENCGLRLGENQHCVICSSGLAANESAAKHGMAKIYETIRYQP
ncbi:hypothetical protein QZM18_29310 [Burkholderia diffusa]|nr:hypothetical protein [Burkholderia diffusa]